jgi:hypothetical protein
MIMLSYASASSAREAQGETNGGAFAIARIS